MINKNTFDNPNSQVTVHVVDDDRNTRDALRQLLTRAGYPVKLHASGSAFLNAYDGLSGCMILDLAMPEMRGEALLEEINRLKLNVVVLVMTGHATIEAAIRVTRAGAMGLLQKPFDNDQLLKKLGEVLHQAQSVFARHALIDEYRQRIDSLTVREREVLDLMLADMTSQAIATYLGNSKKTVDIHRARVMRKMEASTITELIMGWTMLFSSPAV